MQREFRSGFIFCGAFALFAFVGCQNKTQKSQAQSASMNNLSASLAQVSGSYTWDEEGKLYRYSNKEGLEAIIVRQDREKAMSELIECLDNPTLSQSTLNGKPVVTGIVCYEALTQLASHEPTDAHGDVAKSWLGEVSPKASLAELKAAKEAWQQVQKEKTYSFL